VSELVINKLSFTIEDLISLNKFSISSDKTYLPNMAISKGGSRELSGLLKLTQFYG
jgi:hypothetical protein